MCAGQYSSDAGGGLKISWENEILSISGPDIPVGKIEVMYLEAFCRPASHSRDWYETMIPHKTVLLSARDDGMRLSLKSVLADGVVVSHVITAGRDEVDFRVSAHNSASRESEVHWAQPCIRVGEFTGFASSPRQYDYLGNCFVFLSGELSFMPTPDWAVSARYTPGQVWRPASVNSEDVNPRPLNPLTPSNGLIGCFSQDRKTILATAWEPYQELFQGVIQCIHSDFRIGGLKPGERKNARGKIYVTRDNVDALLNRYRKDFPEHES